MYHYSCRKLLFNSSLFKGHIDFFKKTNIQKKSINNASTELVKNVRNKSASLKNIVTTVNQRFWVQIVGSIMVVLFIPVYEF